MRTLFDRPAVLALALFATAAAAFALRVAPGFDRVFPDAPGDRPTVFREVDPWYHARAIEHQVANFPERFRHDPYLGWPDGGDVPVAPLFDLAAAATVRLVAGPRPDAATVARIAAWLPAILGALVVFPTARLAWRLGRPCERRLSRPSDQRLGRAEDRRPGSGDGTTSGGGAAAALAAASVAVLPGQFLARSLLGFTDHHVLEVLASTALLAALVGALDGAATARSRLVSSLLFGLALLALLLAWVGGAAIVLVLVLFLAFELAHALATGRDARPLARATLPGVALAAAGTAVAWDGVTVPTRNLVAALVALVAVGVVWVAGRASAAPRARALFGGGGRVGGFVAVAATLALAGLAALVAPALVGRLTHEVTRAVRPAGLAATVSEAAPLMDLGPLGAVLWYEFAFAGPLALVGLVLAFAGKLSGGVGAAAEEGTDDARDVSGGRGVRLLAIWTSVLALFALAQNRFLYYLAAPAAVLATLAATRVATWLATRGDVEPRRARTAHGLLLASAFVLAVGLSVAPALERARGWNGPSADWRAAFDWLRRETPEPFGDATTYWRSGPEPPRPSYSVASWWDFGYWILRGAHRVPAAVPTQAGAAEMARLLLAPDESAVAPIVAARGVRYLVLEASLPYLLQGARDAPLRPVGKVRSIALWAQERPERYAERVLRRGADGALAPATLFHPDWYRTLLYRLYFHRGAAVAPSGPVHVAELAPAEEEGFRELVRLEAFPSYEAALAALAGRDPSRFELVGVDPAATCVPLAATPGFRHRWSSPTSLASAGVALPRGARSPATIEIFERSAP